MINTLQVNKNEIELTIRKLDEVFMPEGKIIPVKKSIVEAIPFNELRLYCHFKAIYQIITEELVQYLKNEYDLTSAIEIGAGVGTLGQALGIHCTDNYLQDRKHIKMVYQLTGQPTIKYGSHVEKIEAIDAIKKYKPRVVLGAWITHLYKSAEPDKGGNMYAPDELEIMQLVDKYVMIGNVNQHYHNRLINGQGIYTKIIPADFLYSRAEDMQNVIYEFSKK